MQAVLSEGLHLDFPVDMYFAFAVFIRHTDLDAVNKLVRDCTIQLIKMRVLLDQGFLSRSIFHAFASFGDLLPHLVDALRERLFLIRKCLPEQRIIRLGDHAVQLVLIRLHKPVLRRCLLFDQLCKTAFQCAELLRIVIREPDLIRTTWL